MYTPDCWVKIRVEHPKQETIEKIVGGWSGGYADGDTWRVNSGIERVVEDEEYYDFHGYSGSVYRCYKQSQGIRMSIAGVVASFKKTGEEHGYNVEVVKV